MTEVMEALKEGIGDFWVSLEPAESGGKTGNALVPHFRCIVALALVDMAGAFHFVASRTLGGRLVVPFLQGLVDTTVVGSMLGNPPTPAGRKGLDAGPCGIPVHSG